MQPHSYQRKLDVHGPRTALGYVIAVLGTAAATLGLLEVRPDVSKTNVVLTFLAVVVAAAATGGLGPGAIAAVAGFLAFDILFLPPYYTLVVSDRQDYLSLGVYLVTAFVVSYLVGALERRRIQAERREQETRTLYELSTSLVAHGSLDDTLSSVVRTVRSLFNLAGCAIVLPDGRDGVRIAARDGETPSGLDRILAPTSATGTGGRLQPGQALTVPLRPAPSRSAPWWWSPAVPTPPASARPSGACWRPSPTRPPWRSSRAGKRTSGPGRGHWRRPTGCARLC